MAFIGNTPQNQGFTPAIDYFNGDGVTVTFTLSRPVISVAQMIVAVDNVIQNPSSAYTVSGNSITFTSAPLSGGNNIWVEYTSLITQYNAISQDPSVIGDITASGGYLATGDFGNTFTDGTIVDYVTGMARITTGDADGITLYNNGPAARNPLLTLGANGQVAVNSSGSASAPVISKSDDLNTGIFFPAADTIAFSEGGVESMRINSAGNAGIGTSGILNVNQRLAIAGAKANADASSQGQMLVVDTGAFNTSPAAGIQFGVRWNTAGSIAVGCSIQGFKENPGDGNFSQGMLFTTQANGDSPRERMRISSSGELQVGSSVSTGTSRLQVFRDNPGVYNAAHIEMVSNAGDVVLAFHAGGSTAVCLDHIRGGGSVRCTTLTRGAFAPLEASAFTVGSDYRLKQNITPLTGALQRVSQLPVYRFDYKPAEEVGMDYGDKTVDGFLAHEVAEVVPEAAFGEKDKVNEDGKAVYQTIDQSKIVPLLTAAIQEQQAIIQDLKARIETLEAK